MVRPSQQQQANGTNPEGGNAEANHHYYYDYLPRLYDYSKLDYLYLLIYFFGLVGVVSAILFATFVCISKKKFKKTGEYCTKSRKRAKACLLCFNISILSGLLSEFVYFTFISTDNLYLQSWSFALPRIILFLMIAFLIICYFRIESSAAEKAPFEQPSSSSNTDRENRTLFERVRYYLPNKEVQYQRMV